MKNFRKFGTYVLLLLCMSFLFIGCDQSIQNNGGENGEDDIPAIASVSEKEEFVGAVEDYAVNHDMGYFADKTSIIMPSETVLLEVEDLEFEDLFDDIFPALLSDQLNDEYEYTFKDGEGDDTSYTFEMDSYQLDNFDEVAEFINNMNDEDEENDEPIGYYISSSINPTGSMAFTIKNGTEDVISGSAEFDLEMTFAENEGDPETPYIDTVKLNGLQCSVTLLPDSESEMGISVEIFETEYITEETWEGSFPNIETNGSFSDLRDAIDDFADAVWVDDNPLTVSIIASTADGMIKYDFDFDEILDVIFNCIESSPEKD